jgi:dipeptidyl aminopeptidase/acylaminoacyl peptidase
MISTQLQRGERDSSVCLREDLMVYVARTAALALFGLTIAVSLTSEPRAQPTWGSAPHPGSVARRGRSAPLRSVPPRDAQTASWGPRLAGAPRAPTATRRVQRDPADSGPKRTMAIDDLITAVRVSDPQLSPDGRTVVYVRTTTNLDSGVRNADIWTVPADGSSAAKALITGDKTDNAPRFLPDGRQLVFISNRDGPPQVYVAGADGHGVRRVTSLSGGVQAPLTVSPDGRKIAFVSDVYTQCGDEDCNKRTRETLEKSPVKMRHLARLPFRHWDEWRENLRHHVFAADIDNGNARDVTPGDFDSPPHFYEDHSIAFSRDGAELAFVSKRDGPDREMWTTNHDVWIAPVAGGDARKITTNPAADMQPTFSPDGKLIAVRAQRRAGFEADRWYLDVYDRSGGGRRTVFESPDLSVDDFRFSPDGQSIWFTAEEKGRVNVYLISVAGGTPRRLAQGGAISALQPGSDFAVVSKSSLTAPADLYRVAREGGEAKRLTNENAGWLGTIAMPAPESLTVSGAAGTPVQYWVLKPPHFDSAKKNPVVFLIHGGPQGAWDDAWSYRWNPALWAAQGWVVVAPNPRGSTGFGQRFVDEISRDWCGKAITDLEAVFDAVGRLPYADATRMGIAGASYGGYAVNWIIGHRNGFKVAVSHDGVFNLESMALATEELWFVEWEFGGLPWSTAARRNFNACSPHLAADKIKTPTLVITNELDFRVPVDQGLQLFTALRRNGVPAEALVFPDEGHWVLKALNSRRWHETVFAWMKKYLGSGASATDGT